jgi:hypothetical protein
MGHLQTNQYVHHGNSKGGEKEGGPTERLFLKIIVEISPNLKREMDI